MADYTEVLRQLGDTEEFFRRETKAYKDFRDALTKLNSGMRAVGNLALQAGEVQKLRELAAKAKEAWDIYYGQIEASLLEQVNREVPDGLQAPMNLLSPLDKRRMQILNGMGGLLEGDLDALRNYDPARGLNLPAIILENRGLTADIRGQKPEKVGGSISSRLVMEVNGRKGVFTEDHDAVSLHDVYGAYRRKYPALVPLLERMETDANFKIAFFDSSLFTDPEDLAQELQKGDMPEMQMGLQNLRGRLAAWNLPFPESLREEGGKTWLKSPAFCRQLAEVIADLSYARDSMRGAKLAQYELHNNVPRRNAAMSAVADRLGVSGLIARSKVMKVRTDEGEKTGVFMEWAQGTDLKKVGSLQVVDRENMGKKRQIDSAGVLKDAANLQVLDFICGNVDRHGGNML